MNPEYNSRLRYNFLPKTTTDDYILSLEYILTIIQELFLVNSLEQLMKIVTLAARKIAKSAGATFVLLDHGFSYYAYEDAISPLWKGQRFPLNISISGWVMLNNQIAIIPDIYNDPRIVPALYKHTFVKSMVMIPIGIQKPIAAIGVYWQDNYQTHPEMMSLLQLLADMTVNAMENVRKYIEIEKKLTEYSQSLENVNHTLQQEFHLRKSLEAKISQIYQTDDLTGLYNKRGFFLLAEQQLKLANRTQNNITIIVIEIMSMKQIESEWGEDFAVDTIISMSKLFKSCFRSADTIARLENAEFAILAQGADPNCKSIRKRLGQMIERYNQHHKYPFPLVIKLGFQVYNPEQHLSLDDMITLAKINMQSS